MEVGSLHQTGQDPVLSSTRALTVQMDLFRAKSQWVDLGIHTDVCMTLPDTFGIAGGAISLWVKVTDCPLCGGIVSSDQLGTTGLKIYCISSNIRYDIHVFTNIFTQVRKVQ